VSDALSRRIPVLTALLMLALIGALASAPPASAKTCAEQVVDDWYGNGRVDEIYPLHCYREAIRSLPVDVKAYGNAEEDILRALAYAKQNKPDPGPAGGAVDPSPGTTTDPGAGGGGNGLGGPGDPNSEDTTETVDNVDTSGPSSVPIPLLILGGLALLLLAAGGAGYLSRRAQARREGGPPGPA
jgi:hypothetical protein